MSSYTYDTTVGTRIAFWLTACLVCPPVAVFVGALAGVAMGPAALIVVVAAGFLGAFGLARLLKIDTRESMILSVLSAVIAGVEAVGLVFLILSQMDFS